MQSLPLVSGALRVYDTAKTNSRVVQYTSSLVSSSLRHGTSLLPAGSGERMDEFAGGMLDRLDKYRLGTPASSASPSSANTNSSPANANVTATSTKKKTLDGSPSSDVGGGATEYVYAERRVPPGPYDERGEYPRDYHSQGARYEERDRERQGYEYDEQGGKGKGKRRWGEDEQEEREDEREDGERRGEGKGRVPGWLEATSPFVAPPGPPPPLGREGKSRGHAHDSGGGGAPPNGSNAAAAGEERQVAQRSRWQAMLLEAGGLSAALSDESMRRLRYCLSWLQYATQHIDAQILILRDFIASLHPLPPPGSGSLSLTPDHLRTLAHLRSDIVHTIRQVVGVVSKYAGGALPEPARGRVRGFILDLPKRFSAEGGGAGGLSPGGASSSSTGVATSAGGGVEARHAESTRDECRGGGRGEPDAVCTGEPAYAFATAASAWGAQSARRVLVLATESLDMMRGVTAVVGDSLDRADAWVDRLRTVGIQRGMDGLALPDGSAEHGHWAGATPAWAGTSSTTAPRSPGRYASSSGTRSPAYGSDTRSQGYASGARSPTFAPSDSRSTTYVSSGSGARSPTAYASSAPSPGFGLGGMSLGSSSSRYSTPAPGGEDDRDREREQERDEDGRMEVDD
ncbi:hypothetical protein MVEN_01580200 [Mycena venus]|uniref:Opi1-domain-containing protein n=1 Tax=Mycena venus TaxID=2733690 RepID=A0A8H7CRJ2_9AGAR|nr:hypothetical protein MVEN_01580200 [Mycena venus]